MALIASIAGGGGLLLGQVFQPTGPWAPWLLGLWVTAIGACIGSFLNVVIYRVPAGLSIVRPASRCPRCLHPIRGFDNVPILSWLVLRGRCRDCGAAISARYPLVEAAVASLFAILFAVEIVAGHADIWVALAEGPSVVQAAERWCLFALHSWLLTTLLAAVIIESDRQRIPLRLFAPLLLVRVLTLAIFPRVAGGDDPLALLGASALGGTLAWLSHRTAVRSIGLRGWMVVLVAVALAVGWQSMLIVTFVVAGGLAFARIEYHWRSRSSLPVLAWVFAGTLAAILGRVPVRGYLESPRQPQTSLHVFDAAAHCQRASSVSSPLEYSR
ncbi:MAG: prepilin peptidase [Planctomycetes bacterium]|nr:prepilin peptidase [Planctomycetota bacterium]